MKAHGIEMKGPFKAEILSTLPSWTSEDEGREVYVQDEERRYYGDSTSWVDYSSGDFGSLDLITTGEISGRIPMIDSTGNYTLGYDDEQEAYGHIVWMSGENATLSLPSVIAGMTVLLYSTDATAKRADPHTNDGIRNAAARSADGLYIELSAGIGNYVSLVGDSADGWSVMGHRGTITVESV